MNAITLILSLLATNCIPVLLYGLEACYLSKAQTKSLAHSYDAVFFKVFKSFDNNVIKNCQYYTGYLPAPYALDAGRASFLLNLKTQPESIAGFLCKAVGHEEWRHLESVYHIDSFSSPVMIKKVWAQFQLEVNL